MAAHFEPVVDANCRLVAPPLTRQTAIGGYPKVASYDMLGEQLHYSNPVKHGDITFIVLLHAARPGAIFVCFLAHTLDVNCGFRLPRCHHSVNEYQLANREVNLQSQIPVHFVRD